MLYDIAGATTTESKMLLPTVPMVLPTVPTALPTLSVLRLLQLLLLLQTPLDVELTP